MVGAPPLDLFALKRHAPGIADPGVWVELEANAKVDPWLPVSQGDRDSERMVADAAREDYPYPQGTVLDDVGFRQLARTAEPLLLVDEIAAVLIEEPLILCVDEFGAQFLVKNAVERAAAFRVDAHPVAVGFDQDCSRWLRHGAGPVRCGRRWRAVDRLDPVGSVTAPRRLDRAKKASRT